MRMEIIDLGERQVAVGLEWHPVSATEKPMQAARNMDAEATEEGAEQTAYNVVCLYLKKHGAQVDQFGLGRYPDDTVPGRISALAAAFANQHPDGTVIGRFKLEDGRVWLVQVIDGVIDVQSDVIVEDDEAADELLATWEQHAPSTPRFIGGDDDEGEYDWEKVLAYFLEITVPPTRSFTLAGSNAPVLVPLYGAGLPKWVVPAAISAVALIILVAVVMWWLGAQREKAAELERQRQMQQTQEEMRLEREARERAAASQSGASSTVRPAPTWFLDTCVDRFLAQPVTVRGWALAGWECVHEDGKDVVNIYVEWERLDGAYNKRPPDTTFNTSNPNRALHAINIDIPRDARIQPKPDGTARQVGELIYQIGLEANYQTNIGWDRGTRALPPGAQMASDQQKPSYVTAEFTFSGPNQMPRPRRWVAEQLQSNTGLFLKKLDWTREGDTWAIAGGLVAQPEPDDQIASTH